MKQYWDIKSKYTGMILMFRLGDFYEMFGEDAIKAHPILEVTLTQRNGLPMCGVPYHSVNTYLKKLIDKGLKAALCDQLEDPALAKGIVKRGVVRVITPGTIIEDSLLESRVNNFLLAFHFENTQVFFASADISTGAFFAGQSNLKAIEDEIASYNPGEILISKTASALADLKPLISKNQHIISEIDDEYFQLSPASNILSEIFGANSAKKFSLDNDGLLCVCGAILHYIKNTQSQSLGIFSQISRVKNKDFMVLGASAVKNLELLSSIATGKKRHCLLEVLDSTKTPMGARTIRQWLVKPLLDLDKIIARQRAVEFFIEEPFIRREIIDKLKSVADIERIMARGSSQTASPRDLSALKRSLIAISEISKMLQGSGKFLAPIPDNSEIIEKIGNTLTEEPSSVIKDGNIIRGGVNTELDELRLIATDTKKYLSDLEAKERTATGITNLKIGYTSVFGYYIEISKAFISRAPSHYTRKQTLSNAERYITQELKSLEEKILSAQERLIRLENSLFATLRKDIGEFAPQVLTVSQIISEIDIFCGFAKNALEYDYCKPTIDESYGLEIMEGRHPVLERALKDGVFVSNDISLDENSRIVILTGPNMSGKSTYLRQAALISIMAQTGSFVPAKSARIGIIDNVFTRIGAGDNIAGGESTFMVEMRETAEILKNYTDRSLIILDEVGRGTSTYDGMSIAWAILEYFADSRRNANKGSKILFATHYFELTSLEKRFEGIVNLNVSVKEWNGDVIFLHKISKGSADKSYGIHVAKIAGLPHQVIEKAYRTLNDLESKAASFQKDKDLGFIDLFAPVKPQILIELEKVNIDSLAPMDALKLLQNWKDKFRN